MSVEIYHFFSFLRDPVFSKYSQSDVLRSISDSVMKFDNLNYQTIYTQEKRKFHFSYHIWHFMCYAGLLCYQDCLFDWAYCVASLPFLFSITIYSEDINSWRVIIEIFSCFFDTISVLASYFLLISLFLLSTIFHVLCSTCRKQSEYFDKRNVQGS